MNHLRNTSDRQRGIQHGSRNGLKDSKNHLRATNDRIMSYSTCIKDMLPGGLTIGNDTYYSTTTSKHQTKAGVRGCDVIVVGVPEGTLDLAGWFRFHYPRLAAEDAVKFCTGRLPAELHGWIAGYQAEMGMSMPAAATGNRQ